MALESRESCLYAFDDFWLCQQWRTRTVVQIIKYYCSHLGTFCQVLKWVESHFRVSYSLKPVITLTFNTLADVHPDKVIQSIFPSFPPHNHFTHTHPPLLSNLELFPCSISCRSEFPLKSISRETRPMISSTPPQCMFSLKCDPLLAIMTFRPPRLGGFKLKKILLRNLAQTKIFSQPTNKSSASLNKTSGEESASF